MIREKEIERYFVKKVEKAGGKAYKWVSPGSLGVPDRIVLMPGGVIVFVELKAPGRALSKQQVIRHDELISFSCTTWVIDSKEKVDDFVWYYSEI